MLGFFLILLVEQAVHMYQDHTNIEEVKPCDNTMPAEVLELPDGYMASSDSTLSEESDFDDPKKAMLKKPKHSASKTNNTKMKQMNSNRNGSNNKSTNNSCATVKSSHVVNDVSFHTHSHGTAANGHGHSHIIDVVKENHGLRCFLLLAALSIHSLFEGMAVGLQESVMALVNLFIGVLLHECLIAFSVGISLAQQQAHLKRNLIVQLCVLFSLMIPVGMAIGLGIGGLHGFTAEITSAIIQGLAAGTFVYVIFFEILPAEMATTGNRLLKVFFMILGFGIILCLQFSTEMHH
jgi:zinc transporter 1/2/3